MGEVSKSVVYRFLDGMADAAAWGAGVSILMKLFPNRVSQIMSWTEMLFGLGYMLGKFYDINLKKIFHLIIFT